MSRRRRLLPGVQLSAAELAGITGRSTSTIYRAQRSGPSRRLAEDLRVIRESFAEQAKRKPAPKKKATKPERKRTPRPAPKGLRPKGLRPKGLRPKPPVRPAPRPTPRPTVKQAPRPVAKGLRPKTLLPKPTPRPTPRTTLKRAPRPAAKPTAKPTPRPTLKRAPKPAPPKPRRTSRPTPKHAAKGLRPKGLRPIPKQPTPPTRKPKRPLPPSHKTRPRPGKLDIKKISRELDYSEAEVREALTIERRRGQHRAPHDIPVGIYAEAQALIRRRAGLKAAATRDSRRDPTHPLSVFVDNVKKGFDDLPGVTVATDGGARPDLAGPTGAFQRWITISNIAEILGPLVTIEERKANIDYLFQTIARNVEFFADIAPPSLRIGFDFQYAINPQFQGQGYGGEKVVRRDALNYAEVTPGNFFDLLNEYWRGWHRHGDVQEGQVMAFTDNGHVLDFIRMDFLVPNTPPLLPVRNPYKWKAEVRRSLQAPQPPSGFKPLRGKRS